jgi:hypothetical protein
VNREWSQGWTNTLGGRSTCAGAVYGVWRTTSEVLDAPSLWAASAIAFASRPSRSVKRPDGAPVQCPGLGLGCTARGSVHPSESRSLR